MTAATLRLSTLVGQPPSGRATILGTVGEIDDIVVRCQKGDAAAFRALFARYRSEVARLAFRMMGPGVDLEDTVQEVFLQVHKSLKDFRGQSKFTTWLHRVTVNVVLMQRRAAKSRPKFVHGGPETVEQDPHLLPDDDAVRLQRMRAFGRTLDRLAEKKRTVFVLHEIEGMAPAEIAKVVGSPVLTVRTRLFYARRDLAQLLREEPLLAHFADAFAQGVKDEQRGTTEDRAPAPPPARTLGETQ